MSKINLPKSFFKKNTLYFTAFGIPVFILILIYVFRGVFPFGDNCYLRSDMYHQYITFLAALQDKLKNGESLLYSWDIGGGVNFVALFAYYLATPINWLTVLFPQKYLIELLSAFMIFKTGLCGVTFSYYLSKKHNTKNIAIAAISVFYALSGYMCSYNWNVMWLDCIVLFPLIILGLERLIKEGKGILYCITLALSILSNYYISIMICIFCVLYFFMYTFSSGNFKKPVTILKNTGWFAVFSLLAGGIAACLLLPEVSALMLTASGEFNFPKDMTRYFSIFEMISRQLIMVDPAIFSAHEPNIYSGLIIFILVPLYALNPNTSTKEKIGRFIFIFLFYLSFNLNIPNYIWHGLHFPNSLPCRQSFIFTFLLLAMSYEGFVGLKKASQKDIWHILGAVVLLFLLIEHLFVDDEYSYSVVYVSILFIILYGVVFGIYRRKICSKAACTFFLFLVVFFEVFTNAIATTIFTTGRTAYVSDNTAISTLIDKISEEDTGFYRVEKLKRRTKNDAAWHHYHGLSLFSSTANAGYANLLASLGGERSTNSYGYYGATPLVEALTNVKYVLAGSSDLNSPLRTLTFWEDNQYLYKNNYTFGMGFMVPDTLEEEWNISVNNPFTVQNSFVALTTDLNSLFKSVPYYSSGDTIEIDGMAGQQIYVYITSSGKNFKVSYENILHEENRESASYSMNQKYIMDLGYLTEDTYIKITSDDGNNLSCFAYSINNDVFTEFCERFGQSIYKVTSYDDTHMEGTIDVKEAGTFVSNIIYEEGWTVLVDGEEVEYTAFKDALISFPLDEGTHEISFSYFPKGLKEGLLISGVSLAIFIAIIVLLKLSEKKHKTAEEACEVLKSDNESEVNLEPENSTTTDANIEPGAVLNDTLTPEKFSTNTESTDTAEQSL